MTTSPPPATGAGDVLVLERGRLPGLADPVAIVVGGGRIRAVGTDPVVPAGAERVDLDGRTVLPGLWDTHVHVEQWAAARRRLDLRDA
jgi:imidazolonepropionase-like amidohydrolase